MNDQPPLQSLRERIDSLDQQIQDLLNERARCAQLVAQAKIEQGERTDFYRPEREAEVLRRVRERNQGPLGDAEITRLFREIMSACLALEKPLLIGYLGPEGTFTHAAVLKHFGHSVQTQAQPAIDVVFREVEAGDCDYGVVPIENSTDGRIVDTLGMFTRLPTRICGEVQLRIHHYLLGRCERADVKEIYSKPQALSQCRDWLAKHMPLARLVEMTSTAAAAQLAAEKPGAAAIASLQAATNYGLNAIAEKIEDNKNNITRFAVIGDHDGRRTGQDKTALMFEIAHVPGSLADTMAIFKRNRLNLTWIESFPMPNTEKEYLFFVELEGHHEDTKIKRAMEALRRKTKRLEILGAYHRSEPVESP